MKRYLTAFFLLLACHVFGQPKEFTVEAAQKDISNNNFFVRCPLKWMPDSCLKILNPFDVEVYYTWGNLKVDFQPYDSLMQDALKEKYGSTWDTLWWDCALCFMGHYGKYKATQFYDLDGDILDPGLAQRHIKEGKFYYLIFGSLTSEAIPEGFNECEREVYEGLGLEIKWLGGYDVKLAPLYNSYVFGYLDSLNQTSGTEEKARQALNECLDAWNEKTK